MKLLLLALLAFALVHCQHPYYAYYYPRVMNPLVYYNQMPSYRSVPFNWLRYFGQNQNDGENILIEGNSSDQYELLGDADVIIPSEQSQLRSNSFGGSNQQDLPMARFFFNQPNAGLIDGSSTSTLNFALKTLVHTTLSVRTVFTTARCIPASLIAYATPCSRRRRDIESLLMPLEPSPPENVEITTRVTPLPLNYNDHQLPSATPLIASSKANGNAELEESSSVSLARAKRFFIARTTLTSFSFTTSTLKRPVTITAAVNGGPSGCVPGVGLANCLLACIPQSYIVC